MRKIKKSLKRLGNTPLRYVVVASAMLCVVVMGVSIYLLDKRSGAIDWKTYCPRYGPMGHYVLLQDRTGPSGIAHVNEQSKYYRRFLRQEVPESYLVSLHNLEVKSSSNQPVIAICNPWSGKTRGVISDNLREVKNDYEKKLMTALLEPSASSTEPTESELFEKLENLANELQRSQIDGPKRLYIISTMNLRESEALRNEWNFGKSRESASWGKSLAPLKNIELHVLLVEGESNPNRKAIKKFWMEYAQAAGVKSMMASASP